MSSSSSSGCNVQINLPDGKYVGTDWRTITVEADPSDAANYDWETNLGPDGGLGEFNDYHVWNPEFSGVTRGRAEVEVEISAEEGCSDSRDDLVVIETDTFRQFAQVIPEVYEEGDSTVYHIPYNDGAELRAVNVATPYDELNPYLWDTEGEERDLDAEVNHQTGDVDVTLRRPGSYIIEMIRISGANETSSFVEIHLRSAPGKKSDDQKSETTVKKPKPTADLVLISSSTNDNGYLSYARNHYSNEKAVGSVQDAIDEINKYSGQLSSSSSSSSSSGSQKFSVLIIDHGRAADISIGGGRGTVPGKYINGKAVTKTDRDKLTAACKGKVHTLTLCGCHVADIEEGANGEDFLQQLADDGQMTVKAPNCNVYWGYRLWWQDNFKMGELGGWVTSTPGPPE